MNLFLRCLALVAVLGTLSACSVPGRGGATPEEIAAAAYRHSGPTRLTLFTMLSNETGNGAHTSLMINGSQRIAFDPAGSFRADGIVAREDVVYGMTPSMVDIYTRFHARETYHVVVQELDVSPEVAELALQLAISNGAVQQAYCARSTAEILRRLPGFEDAPVSFYPRMLMEYFQEKGATFSRLYEYDDDDKSKLLAEYTPEYIKAANAQP